MTKSTLSLLLYSSLRKWAASEGCQACVSKRGAQLTQNSIECQFMVYCVHVGG